MATLLLRWHMGIGGDDVKAINRRYKRNKSPHIELNPCITINQYDEDKIDKVKELVIRVLIEVENFEYSLARVERRVSIIWQYFPMVISVIAVLVALSKWFHLRMILKVQDLKLLLGWWKEQNLAVLTWR